MALRNAFEDLNLESTQINILEQFDSEFSRISEKRFLDTEEVRYDIPPQAALANSSIYIGVALDGTDITESVWTVVRVYFNQVALPVRQRIRKNVKWSERTLGW